MNKFHQHHLILLIIGGIASPAFAQEEPASPSEEDIESVVVVGSRRPVRSLLDSTTPVDSLQAPDLIRQGSSDLDDLLRNLVPSYNVTVQPASDEAVIVRPANLRGLPPDATVVLVNGKRRHRSAVISFIGQGLSDGAHGVDLASIPSLALEQVDLLRDGAAAQYGSDAIAGVLNFVLRDNPSGVEIVTRVGSYLNEDIDEYAWSTAINTGMPISDAGFLNLTLEYGHQQPTNRSAERNDARPLRQLEDTRDFVRDPAQIWGSPKVSRNFKSLLNAGYDVSNEVSLYAFGNFAQREVQANFFYRDPRDHPGIYRGDALTRNVDGEEVNDNVIRVADLTPDGTGNCPEYLQYDDNTLQIDTEAYNAILDNDNCFVWNELLPGGFAPRFGGQVTDLSLTGGLRGTLAMGLSWDVSASVGSNQVDFTISDTVNSSLGPDSPQRFNPGGYQEVDQTYNLDLSYPMEVNGFASPLTMSTGFEYRKEVFTTIAGDITSYEAGPLANQGFSPGSNGYPGFSPTVAGTFSRENVGAYLDLVADIFKPWTVQFAARIEDFDTFGTQGTVKASSRLAFIQPDDNLIISRLAIRGSVGTGYRAPSAGQANVSKVSTVSVAGELLERGTVPPTNPVAVARGARPLEPETSLNITGGFVLSLGQRLEITADYYNIEVQDRISQSNNIPLTVEERQALEAAGITGASNIQRFRFFTNAFDTTTQGLDVVTSLNLPLDEFGNLGLSVAYGWNETTVGERDEDVITDLRVFQLEETIPKHRGTATLNYFYRNFRLTTRGRYFDSFKIRDREESVELSAKGLLDLELGATLFSHLTLVVGGNNILDTRPDENPESIQGRTGALYPRNAPTGFNGGFYYTRVQLTF